MTAWKSRIEFVKIERNETVIRFLTAALGLILSGSLALAGSATWLAAPASNDWNTAGNWTPGGPPNGPRDAATFQSSAVAAVAISGNTQVDGIIFSAGGNTPYTITASPAFALTLRGSGITNHSGITQSFVAAGNNGGILFANSASAGLDTAFTSNGGEVGGEVSGLTEFRHGSNADHGAFTTNSGAVSGAFGGATQFVDSSNAGYGTFITNGRTVIDAGSGVTLFYDSSHAGNATFTTNGGAVPCALGGYVIFFNSSTASNSSFTNNGGGALFAAGGATQFFDNSSASNGAFIIDCAAASGGFGALIQFFNTSTAASGTFTTNGGSLSGKGGGDLEFHDTSTAANGTFTTNGITADLAGPAYTQFFDSSTAGNGTFITNGGGTNGAAGGGVTAFGGSSTAGQANFTTYGTTVNDGSGGGVEFRFSSSAGSSTIITHGSPFRDFVCPVTICVEHPHPYGQLVFLETATAANATLIVHGGTDGGDGGVIVFGADSTGGTARVAVFDNGRLDISGHNDPGVTIGSLEGSGAVFLGMNALSVGSNNLSTTFSGVIKDGDSRPGGGGGTGGSLTKIDTGTLTLSSANTYTGATTINAGKLTVDGSIMSAVTVNNGGTLAGSGTTGSVTVNSGGIVAPGGSQTLHINGNYAQNAGGVLKIEVAGADPSASGHLDITGSATLDGTLEVRFVNGFLPTNGQVFKLLHVGGAFAGSFAQIIFPDLRAGFQFQAEFVNGSYQITALNDGVAATGFLNISTRMRVGTGDNVLIGGFIVTGNAPKKVILRAIGPSLAVGGTPMPGRLADPTLELRDNAGGLIFSNDNWVDSPQVQEIINSTIPPTDEYEAAIVATLAPGNYTAVMRGVGNTTGIGVVEVYDLAPNVPASLANISSRGFVETGDNVMIGGFIAGNQAMHVMVRAIGPSLTQFGIANALADPTLELHNSNGAIIAFNNDWQDTDQAAIAATGIPPTNDKESAIVATLAPGNYTAIVRGLNDTTGVGLVEVYNLR